MREFILHTSDKASAFDLNGRHALATEPSGLGNAFSLSYMESERGKHLTNVKPAFEPIKLKIYFNADGTDGYVNYKSLLSFLSVCGMTPFLFEYREGVTSKYCDVVLKSIPKSEINESGIFAETLTLERQSYWYEVIEEEFVFEEKDMEPVFPLVFPFGFQGSTFINARAVQNAFFEPAPISMRICGSIIKNLKIYLKNANGEVISEIAIQKDLSEGAVVTIDPTTKRILVLGEDGSTTNGYDITDKTKQSFLYLPQGAYTLEANINQDASGWIELSIKKYLFD